MHCTEIKRNNDKRRYNQYKQEALLRYSAGDIVACVCCDETRALTIDHINGDGARHRRNDLGGRGGGARIYAWLKKNEYPDGFQTLCLNCNSGRRFGLCPHSPNFERVLDTRYKRYAYRIRFEVLERYSSGTPQCASCSEEIIEFLTIDHVEGSGVRHRAKLTKSIYKWLRAEGYPNGFQVLCYNCNYEKHVFDGQ